jgi:hypothetical protein
VATKKTDRMTHVFADDVAQAIARISDQVSFEEMLKSCRTDIYWFIIYRKLLHQKD